MDRLGSATEELNLAIREVEQALEALDLGVTAAVDVKYSKGVFTLRFGKSEKEWRLIVEFRDGTWGPLLNASREVRVEAMNHLGGLHLALIQVNNMEEGQVRNAIGKARAFCKNLEAAKVLE